MSLEQLDNTVNGWVENRKCIADESIPEYDDQFADVLDQFKSQGVDVLIDLEDQEPNGDAEKATVLIQEIRDEVSSITTNTSQWLLILRRLNELETVLFGEEQK